MSFTLGVFFLSWQAQARPVLQIRWALGRFQTTLIIITDNETRLTESTLTVCLLPGGYENVRYVK